MCLFSIGPLFTAYLDNQAGCTSVITSCIPWLQDILYLFIRYSVLYSTLSMAGYSQILIYMTMWTGAIWSRRTCPRFHMGFKPWVLSVISSVFQPLSHHALHPRCLLTGSQEPILVNDHVCTKSFHSECIIWCCETREYKSVLLSVNLSSR